MKQIVRLTESDLHKMIKEVVNNIIAINKQQLNTILSESRKRAIWESDHRDATHALCSNMDAEDELARGNDIGVSSDGTIFSYYDKRRESSEQIYAQLTQGVKDNVGEYFHLSFSRKEPDESSSEVHFFFTEVLLLTDNRVVLKGDAKMSRSDIPIGKNRPKTIQIDYHFNENKFYEAVYCKNNTVRDIREISLDIAGINGVENVKTAETLIHFLTLCYYSKEDKKTNIANKPPMKGKPIVPFTHH